MKSELPCSIVRDLLPSYLEGLTEAETTTLVDDHLEACEECRSRYEAMAEPSAPSGSDKEVDYLKHVRTKNRKKIILSVLTAVVLVLTGISVKLFWLGWPCSEGSARINISQSEDHTALILELLDSTNPSFVIQDLIAQTQDGITHVTAREVLASPFHTRGPRTITLPLEGIQELTLFGRTIWQQGEMIDLHTGRLMELKVPYVGDAPALDRLISNMDLDAPHTLALQTDQAPYGATIHFTDRIEEHRRFMADGNAYLLLALVGNLGEVSWDDPSGYSTSFTLEDADAALPGLVDAYNTAHSTSLVPLKSVKDYGNSLHDLELLRNILGV